MTDKSIAHEYNARQEVKPQDNLVRWTSLAQKWVEDIFIDRGMIILPRDEALSLYESELTRYAVAIGSMKHPVDFGSCDSILMGTVDVHLASKSANRGEMVGFVEVEYKDDAKVLSIAFSSCHIKSKRPEGEIAIPTTAIECRE